MGVSCLSLKISVMCVFVLFLSSLATMSSATLDKCADQCSCKWKGGKRTVECVNRSLTGIPDWIDPETQVFDASGNDIRVLASNIFVHVDLTNLQRLYMRNCRMHKIDSEAFTGLTNLVELDLSNNRLTSVPSSSFLNTPFLRDLSLSNNPLNSVPSHAFRNTPNLVKLDLSHCQLSKIEENGFKGLDQLESLRLNDNRISTLYRGTFDPLNKLTTIELHENPWICNCHLRELKMWLVKNKLPTLIAPICQGPEQLVKRSFTDLTTDDFACRPVLMIPSRYVEATIGENASIVCRVSSVPPAKVSWFWNGKLLTNHSAFSSYQKILIYEDGLNMKRSTLVLTNAQESDSSEFYCLAENRAGSVEANFTLHVSLRTAGMSTLGSGQIAGISAALVVLILLILLVILVLFVRLRRMPMKDVKNPASMDSGPNGENSVGHENNGDSTIHRGTRNKSDDTETTSFSDGNGGKPPVSLDLSYVQRAQTQQVIVAATETEYSLSRYEHRTDHHQEIIGLMPAGDYSSSGSLMPIENPDLIRDTRRGSIEDLANYGSTGGVGIGSLNHLGMDARLLYPGVLWDSINSDPRTSAHNPNSPYITSKELLQSTLPTTNEPFPPGAKQLRVWQKGVPVLPPVSALKRVLGSTRSSPDEGYQEGTGTDV
ncbi:leucine-rich repeat-containing protein 24-like [Venturia canescens]|uniref:leucine-rich repeat-containing protein 24-like n=1 Tax=Venturia canescens TaxID=32260 RepID=UPI001C9D01B7|nr:leucine-rich repeat-containing protein 24-like [Venturia canescens]